MKFNDFDTQMRAYEQSLDRVIPPDCYIAARIDGRSFTRLTKETCHFEAPFDIRFRDLMENTVRALMECGFRVIYGYTQSDEISLLFRPGDDAFGRKVRKYNSVLAGVASASFSLQLGMQAVFDCRIAPLPTLQTVCDYFLWRQEDALRNALNGYCYWTLRKNGISAGRATGMVKGKSFEFKIDLLSQYGIVFDEVPSWQKNGIGVFWKTFEKQGNNPMTGESVTVTRKKLFTDTELPVRTAYADYIKNIILSEQPVG